jgi:hypothetical protein
MYADFRSKGKFKKKFKEEKVNPSPYKKSFLGRMFPVRFFSDSLSDLKLAKTFGFFSHP